MMINTGNHRTLCTVRHSPFYKSNKAALFFVSTVVIVSEEKDVGRGDDVMCVILFFNLSVYSALLCVQFLYRS